MLRNQLKPAFRRKRRDLSSSGVRLQHVNAQSLTARHTVKHIQDFKLRVLRCPPHSPDLAPTDFHLFWPLKDALFGLNLRSETYSGRN
jgi:histone-lysine N-methyltransferase SETMAR